MRTEPAGDGPLRNRGRSARNGRSAAQPQRKGDGNEGERGEPRLRGVLMGFGLRSVRPTSGRTERE